MINGVGGTNAVYTAPLGASGDSLTPDAMLLYCAAQLHDMDTQVKQQMAGQQAQRGAQSKITDLKQLVAQFDTPGGINENDGATKKTILLKMKEIYDSLPAGDPTRNAIQTIFDGFRSTSCCNDDLGNKVSLANYTPEMADADSKIGSQDGKNFVGQSEVKDLESALDSAAGDIGKNADIQMISLQSLVSQRQMAVQIATNLINKLNETLGAVIQNVK